MAEDEWDRAAMDKALEFQIRELAQPLWESAARPYGMALDFWLMAEQMVLEMMTATARMSERATAADSFGQPWELPEAAPVTRIRELAELMWEAAGRQYGMAQDFWLAAERHILAMMRAASGNDEETRRYYQELASLPPGAYMERIRRTAYYLWEAAGRQYGRALDFWLVAEQQTLETLAGAAARGSYPGVQRTLEPAGEPAVVTAPSPEPSPVPSPGSDAASATDPDAERIASKESPANKVRGLRRKRAEATT